MSNMTKLNNSNYDEIVTKGTVLVDFYADWCGPCKMIAPIIESIASEREDIKVCKVNVDECQQLAIGLGIVSIPTLIVYKDGKEAARMVGLRGKEEILTEL